MQTLQTMFDRAYIRIANFGRSVHPDHGCRYRANAEDVKGAACGVGAMIDDDVYTPRCEDVSVGELCIDDAGKWAPAKRIHYIEPSIALAAVLNASGVPATEESRDFMRDCQATHDNSVNTEHCLTEFRQLANRWDLTVPSVPK